tara:strand:- start:29 stop:349 length:321 start_codon:yes stop_codon:yes gene_type:complete
MKKIISFTLFNIILYYSYASFPVDETFLNNSYESTKFKLNTLAFILGILTTLLLPYSLLLLFIRKKNFRGSLAYGWLAGALLIVLIVIIGLVLLAEGGFFNDFMIY